VTAATTSVASGLVEATGRPPEEIVEVYGFLVNPRWSFMDFLLNTEETKESL
jgi:hypothetical protein